MKKNEIENRFRKEGLADFTDINIRDIASSAVLPEKNIKQHFGKKSFVAIMVAVTVFIIGITVFAGVFFGSTETTVIIEVNPAVAMSVTPANTVKSVEMLNDDAIAIFNESKIKNKSLDEATDYIINTLYKEGYLEDGKDVKVTVNGKNKNKNQKTKERITGKCNGWAHKYGKKWNIG